MVLQWELDQKRGRRIAMFRLTINKGLEEIEFVFSNLREMTDFLSSALVNEENNYRYEIEKVEDK